MRPALFGMMVDMFDALGGEIVDIFLQNFGMTLLHEFYESSAASQSYQNSAPTNGEWTAMDATVHWLKFNSYGIA